MFCVCKSSVGVFTSVSARRMHEVVFISGARTPIGSFNGSLKSLSAPELGSIAIRESVKRSGLTPDQVYMGNVLQAGSRQAPARQAALNAGLPVSVECTTINKLCASGLKSIMLAAQSISLEPNEVIVAGGMESMSQAPFLLPRTPPKYGGQQLEDSILYDGLLCAFNNIHMGQCTERLISEHKLNREEQDKYAIRSYERAIQATKDGKFLEEIIPVEIKERGATIVVTEDETPKLFDKDRVSKLKPVFEVNGTITSANASKLNDAAAAVVLTSREKALECNVKPLAKVISYADGAMDPVYFGLAPSVSMKAALSKANLKVDMIDLFEINEAFSAVPLLNIAQLGIDLEKVNIHGGAVSMGHPVGMSGTRILLHLINVLQPGQLGLASICNGGGGSSTMIIEKL